MNKTYKIPMNRVVILALLAFVVAVTAGVTWSFRSGLTWTAVCLIVVAGPLSALYWYMLYVNPNRTTATLTDAGLHLVAPPFADAVVPWAAVTSVRRVDLTQGDYAKYKSKKYMQFAGYRSGLVELKSGQAATVVAKGAEVVHIETSERDYLLGPADLDGFLADVEAARAN